MPPSPNGDNGAHRHQTVKTATTVTKGKKVTVTKR
jgi:hypothetical protein